MRRRKRRQLMRILAGVLAVGAAVIFASRHYSETVKQLKNRINDLNLSLDRYKKEESETVSVCTVSAALPAGKVLEENDITVRAVPACAVPEDVLTSIAKVQGRTIRIDVAGGTCITSGMLADEQPDKDVREIEYDCVEIRGSTGLNSVIDVRILYPDGTDYIVLAGKRIVGISDDLERIVLRMNEEEILRMDSAMVDIFSFPGTGLYAAEYPESTLQNTAKVNYTPSEAVIGLIMTDPNIERISSSYMNVGGDEATGRRSVEYED